MSIAKSIGELFSTYGNVITITKGEDIKTVKGFVQPLRYKNKMYIDGNYLSAGYLDGSHFLYIGSPDVSFKNETNKYILECAEEKYVIKQAQQYHFSDTPIYIWAVLTPYAEE